MLRRPQRSPACGRRSQESLAAARPPALALAAVSGPLETETSLALELAVGPRLTAQHKGEHGTLYIYSALGY